MSFQSKDALASELADAIIEEKRMKAYYQKTKLLKDKYYYQQTVTYRKQVEKALKDWDK